jgi:hypothetical protein
LIAASAAEGNTDFNRFYSQLSALPMFKSVSMPKPTVVTSLDAGPTPGKVSVAAMQASKVSFEVVCELP